MRRRPTLCPSCNRVTRTVNGLCPNCGRAKEGGPPAAPRKIAEGDVWGTLDDVFLFSLWFFPGLALVIFALVFLASDLILLAGLVLLVAPLVVKLAGDR